MDHEGRGVEEWTEPSCWWCENPEVDPWIWREIIAGKRKIAYGMPVSIMLPPETAWGYDVVTSAYSEKPSESWKRIYDHVKDMYEESDDSAIVKLIGKKPEE